MYLFQGEFKRKKTQSLSGAIKSEGRNAFLSRVGDERKKREDVKKKHLSANVIQAFYRGTVCRANLKAKLRTHFDTAYDEWKSSEFLNLNILSKCLCQISYFYRSHLDSTRLLNICQNLIRNQTIIPSLINSLSNGIYQVKKFLLICCRCLEDNIGNSQHVAVTLRLLEIYTQPKAYHSCQHHTVLSRNILQYLMHNYYFKTLRFALENKVHSVIEYTSNPPTPMAECLFDLVMKPISLIALDRNCTDFRNCCMQSLCREFFSNANCEQIFHFFLPCLSVNFSLSMFSDMINSLIYFDDSYSSDDFDIYNRSYITVEYSPSLLYCLIILAEKHLQLLSDNDLKKYFTILHKLMPVLKDESCTLMPLSIEEDDDDDVSDDAFSMDTNQKWSVRHLRQECLNRLNGENYIKCMVKCATRIPDSTTMIVVCNICYTLICCNKVLKKEDSFLYLLVYNPSFIHNIWKVCSSLSTLNKAGTSVHLLTHMQLGRKMLPANIDTIIPVLVVFCCFFNKRLLLTQDDEFYHGHEKLEISKMPFSIEELIPMSQILRDACLGIIELVHPETSTDLKENFTTYDRSNQASHSVHHQLEIWAHVFQVTVRLVKQIYARDVRLKFCPPGNWLTQQINIHTNKLLISSSDGVIRRSFGALSPMNKYFHRNWDGPPLSIMETRCHTVLTEMPFVIPFEERVKVFHRMIQNDKAEIRDEEMGHHMNEKHIDIKVRRNFLYEDAFDKLSYENEPNFKLKIRVEQLVNFAGLDEAGIDGGGLLREFLSELVKTAFNPQRGYFIMTEDKLLYPNSQSYLFQSDFIKHYYFLGRILGKCIYENLLIELPFATFFLTKILSRDSRAEVDIHHLKSMDPELYVGLMRLKDMSDDQIASVGLDFTITNDEFGKPCVVELKKGGKDILVSSDNKIEYIHLVANYRLNIQMKQHVNAFREGLANVINLEWLRMFDHSELQTLISGAEVAIDIHDLRVNTNYNEPYNDEHLTIQYFWSVVSNFTDHQKRLLLRFVTSCSRPPLLGFKELNPSFCINPGGNDEDRLPTASTCMNLLKLPMFSDKDTLREKLTYAIEAGAGFELS